MMKQVDFFFDFGSPAAYLAYTQLPRIAAAAGATIHWRPMLLGGVFKATGNASPVMVAAKGKWMNADLARWAARYGVPLKMPAGFPINTLALMRGSVGMQMREPARFGAYVDAVYSAMFGRGENMGDFEIVGRVLGAAGFDAAAFMALTADPEVKQGLIANTDEAVARGAFGAPTMFVGDEMHFGQDRLDFVASALAR
ncbi:MAG: 2-hydroxychromene-2-carboxylate isomerase [Burkholderiales bacterium]|nr:2-hydroxychromene-2-carboxylate isomerase [Burkholderiales bacterium]